MLVMEWFAYHHNHHHNIIVNYQITNHVFFLNFSSLILSKHAANATVVALNLVCTWSVGRCDGFYWFFGDAGSSN